jgi:preprotein translocase subunit SecG
MKSTKQLTNEQQERLQELAEVRFGQPFSWVMGTIFTSLISNFLWGLKISIIVTGIVALLLAGISIWLYILSSKETKKIQDEVTGLWLNEQ